MTDKHTPGPWKIDEDIYHGIIVGTEPGFAYSRVAKFNISGRVELDAANAHLIKAAPDLLKELRSMLSIYLELYGKEPDGELFIEVQRARKAISKATGEEG